jgi:hypothetical protein
VIQDDIKQLKQKYGDKKGIPTADQIMRIVEELEKRMAVESLGKKHTGMKAMDLKSRAVNLLISAIKAQAVEDVDAGREEFSTTPHEVELLSRLQELEKDKIRLDWLADVNNHVGNVVLPKECVVRNLHSLRAAIDDAMTAIKGREGITV